MTTHPTRCVGCSNADCWTCDCSCHDTPMWDDDFPYWLERTTEGWWKVRWRDSCAPAAMFNPMDFPDAKERCEAIRSELIRTTQAGRAALRSGSLPKRAGTA